MLSKLINYLQTDIWRIPSKKYPPRKSFLLRQLRIFVLSVKGFKEDQCKFRASALTFFTLISIVPIVALMFGIAKGFGLQEKVQAEILAKMEGQTEIAEKVIDFSNSLLKNAQGGFIAGIGVIFLFWSVIKVLSNIENSFNEIWGVKTPRHLGRKFADYLSIMGVCPILLVISSSATVVISSQIETIIYKYSALSLVAPLIMFLLRFLPYCIMWFVLTFVFIFMPNTKVKFKSALIAGVITGTLLQLLQWIYIKFQIGVTNYGAIYGSFAALPLFLIWLQVSWLVILFGAEISFAHQNVETYEYEPDCLSSSQAFKRQLALLITTKIVKDFSDGQPPSTAEQITHSLEIPIRLVRLILFELVQANILSEVKHNGGKDSAYQPAVDTNKLTIQYVAAALEQRGSANIPIEETQELQKIKGCLKTFAEEFKKSSSNLLLKEI